MGGGAGTTSAPTRRLILAQSDAPAVDSAQRIGLAWLVNLRWLAAAGQSSLLAYARFGLGITLGYGVILALVAIASSTNAVLHWRLRRGLHATPALVAAVLVLDTLLLTGMLYESGGASNPFSVFYLVHVALAAMLLSPRWTWLLAVTTTICFGTLFILMPIDPHAHIRGDFNVHLRGMWLSYVLAAGSIGYFMTRVKRSLAVREAQMEQLDALRARSEQVVALSALAAGAAHELGTPLGTIALIAKELEVASRGNLDPVRAREDATLLRGEVDRCRAILATMGDHSGDAQLEPGAMTPTAQIVREIVAALGPARAARLKVHGADDRLAVRTPLRPIVQALVNLVVNALDASSETVELTIEPGPDEICFAVSDRGSGMSPETLARVGEPFFTTKAASRGFGLGLFLVRSFAERSRSRLEIISTPGAGTRVELAVQGGT
ncbi:MAG: ATP-binding protein [Myxococcota bacterium]